MKQLYTYAIVCMAALLCCQTTFAARVMGIITSGSDDMPIHKASVQISGYGSTTSNRNGIYLFKAVPAGHYWLVVKAAGYKTDSILFSVNYKDVQVVNVVLQHASTHDTVSIEGRKYFFLGALCIFLAPFALPIASKRQRKEDAKIAKAEL
jgi:hypothetical protein